MKWIMALVGIALIAHSMRIPNAIGFPSPELARIVVFHLPCAYATTIWAIVGSVYGVIHLRKGDTRVALKSMAANELAFAFACATMATGIIFSKVQWGAFWSWDVRQTTFLIVLLLLAANFAVRGAYEEEIAQRRATSAYSAISLLPIIFLIFVFPKLPFVISLHPQDAVPKFDATYWTAVLSVLGLLVAWSIWAFRTRVRVEELLDTIKNQHGNLANDSGDSADFGVVRPVRVRETDG